MKKLTLFLVATLFSALSFAALNPYAYGLSSTHNADQTELTVNYSLNATATNVDFVLLDGDKVIKTVNLNDKGLDKGSYTATVALDDPNMPLGKKLSWKIEVKGAAHNTTNNHGGYQFYHPSGVDVDNNPESPHFGRIICNEAMNSVKSKTDTYLSAGFGAGIFAFNPAFDPITNGEEPGFNGGYTFTNYRPDATSTAAYAPRRVRISDDGRIFITSLNTDGHVLWEVDPDNLNNWTEVIAGTIKTGDVNSVVNGSGTYIGGPNVALDVKGTGKDLQLVMLSGIGTFQCNEYDLGTATTWNKAPSRQILGNKYIVNYTGTSVEYDNEGGVWFCQYRGSASTSQPAFLHINAKGEVDYLEALANVRAGAFRFNHDFTKVITADGRSAAGTYNQGWARIYDVSKDANGKPVLTLDRVIDMSAMGHTLNDFAWDIADNVYVVGNNKEWIRAYALARTADDIATTPCASKYEFTINSATQMAKASELNPYAYNLTSTFDNTNKVLTINYTLNANANSVDIVIKDGNIELKRVACNGKTRGSYTEVISLASDNLPFNRELSWEVEVKGTSKDVPTQVSTYYSLYCPHGLAIDKDPESNYFGRILVAEAMQGVPASGYVSSGKGAGLYVFNPDFATDKKVHNGGLNFTRILASNGYQPWRVKISEDGRIFVSSLDLNGVAVWEVSKDLQTWTPVIAGTNNTTDYNIYDANSNFVAGLNCSMDVIGSGEDLKLLLYSTNNKGIANNQSGYRLDEYALGTATTWTGTPKNIINGGAYGLVHTNVEFIYDGEGGYWFGASRAGNAGQPNLVHINAAGEQDYYTEDASLYGGDGVLVHNGMLFKGKARTNSTTGNFGVWTIGKDADGNVTLTEKWSVKANHIGRNLNEFAVDFGENLYVVGNSGEKIIAFALPYSGTTTTPCATKFTFSIEAYTMTTPVNDPAKGSVTGAGVYSPGSSVTITATPAPGYKLLYWSDRSTENPRTITMTKNEAISAYFVKEYTVEPTFSITKEWEKTNVPASGSGYQAVGWDGKIYMQNKTAGKIQVFSKDIDAAVDYATSGTGQQIAVDEAGNLIVFNAYFATSNPANILIYKKESTMGTEVSFTLQQAGQCHFFSASGDIYSAEGGYVYFYCQNKTAVNRVKITNGAATAADVTVDVVGDEIFAGNTQNHVMEDIFGNLVAVSRSNAASWINVHTNESSKAFATTLSGIKLSTLGGCTFELAGKELWAFNVGSTHYNSEWNLYNLTDKKFESSENLYTKNKTDKNSAANWLNVQVVDEKTAYIYQFCPTVGAAMWKVTRDHIVSATAENGTVEGAGTYKDNATATLTATPNDGYRFKNWTKNGLVVSTDNPYSFTVTEDVELVANFDGPFCELILNTNDEEKGTVEGAGFYTQGQTATIKATPKLGYKLLYWSDRSTQATRTITMNKKEALSAYFVKVYDEEPTFAIEKVWENTNNVPASANNGFQAVGWDQKIYMKDRLGAAINVYTDTGSELYVNTDAFTSDDALRGDQPIAIDDAGNIIIRSGSGLFYSAPKQVTIYKNGDKTGKVIDFTLPASGRCDFISASGDIYSTEGGYVYFYCQNQTTVSRLYIKNGGASAADISVDKLDNATLTAGSSQSHVFTNIFGDLMTHTRDNNYKVLQEVNVLTGAVSTMNLPNFKKSTLGGCSFELGGKEFIAYNIAGTDYNSEWNLYNMTDKEFVSAETLYAKDRTSKKTSGAANWLNVQVVDEETAYIYQFCPEVAVAVWKVSLINTVVIDERADNTTALAEYNGQKVTAKVTRAFNNDSYKTLTLPFDMTEEQIQDVFGETAIVHEFTSVGEENDMFYLHFDPTTTIEAGKPYILQLPTTSDYDAKDGFTIEGVTISTDLQPITVDNITMQPILNGGGRLDQASQYWLASDNYLYSAGAHPTALLGLRAYFINSTGRPIRARVVYGENEATSIPTVVAPEDNVRKVLKDGQIIIIRGEKQYNIQGQVIE